MGSSTILDIITSVIISGFLLLTALRLNDQANETTILYHSNLTLQENMTAITGILEHDFRRLGFCADYKKIKDPADVIRYADTSTIRFWIDIDGNGTVDSIEYSIGPPSEMADTQNPRDRVLYRRVNTDTPQRLEMGVTQFRFQFFDPLGNVLPFPITEPRAIHSMEISLQIESFAPFDVRYTASNDTLADFQMYWRQIRLAARNLRNR